MCEYWVNDYHINYFYYCSKVSLSPASLIYKTSGINKQNLKYKKIIRKALYRTPTHIPLFSNVWAFCLTYDNFSSYTINTIFRQRKVAQFLIIVWKSGSLFFYCLEKWLTFLLLFWKVAHNFLLLFGKVAHFLIIVWKSG